VYLCLALMCLGSVAFVGAGNQADTVEARRFLLVDADGFVRAELGFDAAPNPFLWFFSATDSLLPTDAERRGGASTSRMALGMSLGQEPLIRMEGRAEARSAELSPGFLHLLSDRTTFQVSTLGIGSEPVLSLRDSETEGGALLDIDEGGRASFAIYGAGGNPIASLGTVDFGEAGEGSVVQVSHPGTQSSIAMSALSSGGILQVHGPGHRGRIDVSLLDARPRIQLHDSAGVQRLAAGLSDDGAPVILLFDEAGRVVGALPIELR
jgi:hypothetical protein